MQDISCSRSPRLKILLALFVFTLSGTFASAQSSPKANPSPHLQDNVQAIKSVLAQQVAAWNRGDIPAFMDGYWKSDDLEFVNAAGIFQGWQDVLKRYEHSYPDRAAMGHLTFSGVEIHALCPDAGFVVGHFRLDREKDGQKDHPEGVFTLIFRKFPAGWKIINDHTTEFPAPPPPKNPS
ncbi:MAG: YybH family protein [Candidatus Acidiferrales bacterium]